VSNMYIASLVITLEQVVVSYNQMYSGFPSYYTCACIWDGSIACIASVALANKTSRCILANTIANILVRVFVLVDIYSKTRVQYLLGAPNS